MADDEKIPPLGRPYKIDLNSEPAVETAAPNVTAPPAAETTALGGFRDAPATPLIIAVNVTVFAAMVAVSGGEAFLQPSQKLLLDFGADYGPLTFSGEFWRIFSSIFVHIGVIHIAMNMYVLWDIGNALERLYGTTKFVAIYLLAGIGGSVCSLFFNPAIISAGASGAVFGSFGALLAIYKGHEKSFNPEYIKAATRSVMFLLAFNLIWGFSQKGIDNAAHIGGFVTGVLAGFAVLPVVVGDKRWSTQNAVWALLLLVMLGAATYADYLAFDPVVPSAVGK